MDSDVSIVAHSGDLDRMLAALMIATGAAASGQRVSIFFTFWGLNALRNGKRAGCKSFVQRMLAWMLPRGPERLPSSRLNLGGLGPRLFRRMMKRRSICGVSEMLDQCSEMGVRLLVCRTSMELLGIDAGELRPGVEFAGVATYLLDAKSAAHTLFI